MLQLPILDKAIPQVLVPRASRQRSAVMTRALVREGLVRDDHVPARVTNNYLGICSSALKSWAEDSLAGLQCLGAKFCFTLGPEEQDRLSGIETGERRVGIWFEGYCHGGDFAVGPMLERMEKLRPRLGATVLHAMDRLACRVAPICTPATVLDLARDSYWCGENDESDFLANEFGSDEERKAVADSMVTRKMFDSTFPKWAINYPSKRGVLSPRALRQCLATLRDRRLRAIVADVIAMSELKIVGQDWSHREGRFIGFPAVLTWGERDALSLRVMDDYERAVGESGDFFEDCIFDFIDLTRPEPLREWIAQMTTWCKAYRLIDGLIAKLSARS